MIRDNSLLTPFTRFTDIAYRAITTQPSMSMDRLSERLVAVGTRYIVEWSLVVSGELVSVRTDLTHFSG